MVIGASVYLVVGPLCCCGFDKSALQVNDRGGLAKTQSLLPVKQMRKAQIDTVVIIIFVRLITELHLLYSPGQRHLIVNQNTEAFNVI